MVVGVVFVEVDGRLNFRLAIDGATEVQVDESEGVVELRIFGVELYRFLEGGHAQGQTIV